MKYGIIAILTGIGCYSAFLLWAIPSINSGPKKCRKHGVDFVEYGYYSNNHCPRCFEKFHREALKQQ